MMSKLRCMSTRYWKGWKQIAVADRPSDVISCIHVYKHFGSDSGRKTILAICLAKTERNPDSCVVVVTILRY